MIEAKLIPAVDALLRALDPRLPGADRTEALAYGLEHFPEWTMGALSQILMDYHSRAEQAAGRPSGFYVDAMRRRMLGDVPEDDLLGFAVGAAAVGERHTPVAPGEHGYTVNHPGSDRWTGGDPKAEGVEVRHIQVPPTGDLVEPQTKRGTGPGGLWTVADAAAEAAQQSQRRREEEILGPTGIPQGGQYPGQPQQRPPAPSDDVPPELARLAQRLEAQRLEEAAIDTADLDDPMQARAAIGASRVLDPEQRSTSVEGNAPRLIPCGAPTSRGPCALRKGHPELPVPGTENGHMAE